MLNAPARLPATKDVSRFTEAGMQAVLALKPQLPDDTIFHLSDWPKAKGLISRVVSLRGFFYEKFVLPYWQPCA